MKRYLPTVLTKPGYPFRFKESIAGIIVLLMLPATFRGQSVSAIITDYQGYFKTAASSPNPIKPMNNHTLLAFTYQGVQYSTGADDTKLNANGETFSAQDFWALPVEGFTGTINSNTKVGVGQLFDGVHAGPSNPPPVNNVALYLTDGIKGLNIGTCIANLPTGAMTFFVHNITEASIGDGIPDILVTQIADPSNSFDRYEFTDDNNNRIGNYKDIVFTNITPVGKWTADFYEASTNKMILETSFTNTDRTIRLWAADLSEFGITAANFQSVRKFKINLSGQSDVAFAAYNNNSIQLSNPLPVTLSDFSGREDNGKNLLSWITQTEVENASFTIERSTDQREFVSIGTVNGAINSTIERRYTFTDAQPAKGRNFYRLKMTSTSGKISYSHILSLNNNTTAVVSVYPNPSKGSFTVRHPKSSGNEIVSLVNASGAKLFSLKPGRDQLQTQINATNLARGIYYLVWDSGEVRTSVKVIIM